MTSRQVIEQFLCSIGFTQHGPGAFIGFHKHGDTGTIFPVHIQSKANALIVRVSLNFVTQCDHVELYNYFNQVNVMLALGKFAVAYTCGEDKHPLVFDAEIPAGPSDEAYACQESVGILVALSLKVVEEHYADIEGRFRRGCRTPEVRESAPKAGDILSLLRVRREGEGGKNA